MSRLSIEFRGLSLELDILSAPATEPTVSCGGTPPEWDMEILSAHVSDEEDFSGWSESEDYSDANAERMAHSWETDIIESLD